MRVNGGFTLWELLWALAIGGVAFGLAVPSFAGFLLDARRTADINALVLAVQIARSEAAKRGRDVVLCKTVDQQRCGGTDVNFSVGWMVFVNLDERSPPHRAPAEPLLYVHEPGLEGTIASNRPFYEFRVGGRRSTNGTVVFCDRRGAGAARAVVVSYTGRPRVSDRDGDGRPLSCA